MLLWPFFRTILYSSFLLNGLQLLVCYVKIVIWIGSDHFFRCIISSFLIVGWSKYYFCRGRIAAAAVASAAPAVAANPTSMDLDLPVDPNEPTYCLCNQVSYGDMVACDNPDVSDSFFSTFQSVRYNQSNDVLTTHALFNICLTVQDRMVSFWLCWFERTTQGKVVLFGLCRIAETQEREVMLTIFRLLVHIQCICC